MKQFNNSCPEKSRRITIKKFILVLFTFSLFLFTFNKHTYARGCPECYYSMQCADPCKPVSIPGSVLWHCLPDGADPATFCPSDTSSAPGTSPAPAGSTTTTTGTPLGPIEGLGPLGTVIRFLSPNDVSPASDRLASVLSMVIGVITIVTGLWFTIRILIAGFTIISAGGDKNKMQESQHMITNSVIGLTVAVAAYALASLFSKILGINFLNITEALQNLNK